MYEYRVVPAPRKGKSAKGMRSGPAKFANAVTIAINEMAAEGWEYLRADTLPADERSGLTSKTVRYHTMLVFRRHANSAEEEAQTEETVSEPSMPPLVPQFSSSNRQEPELTATDPDDVATDPPTMAEMTSEDDLAPEIDDIVDDEWVETLEETAESAVQRE